MINLGHFVIGRKHEFCFIGKPSASGSFFISDGADSTQRAARRRERASPFCFFQTRFPQAQGRLIDPVNGNPILEVSLARRRVFTGRIDTMEFPGSATAREIRIHNSFDCRCAFKTMRSCSLSDGLPEIRPDGCPDEEPGSSSSRPCARRPVRRIRQR